MESSSNVHGASNPGDNNHGITLQSSYKILLNNDPKDHAPWFEQLMTNLTEKGVQRFVKQIPKLRFEQTTKTPNIQSPFALANFDRLTQQQDTQLALAVNITRNSLLDGGVTHGLVKKYLGAKEPNIEIALEIIEKHLNRKDLLSILKLFRELLDTNNTQNPRE